MPRSALPIPRAVLPMPRSALPIPRAARLIARSALAVAFALGFAACSSSPIPQAVPAAEPVLAPWAHENAAPLPKAASAARVLDVIDGDTLSVMVDDQAVTVRLLGIDTPEKAGGPRPAECFGAEASAFVEQLVPEGSLIALTRDVETRDQYGRLLAWVHRADGLFVNLAMVESGHAEPLFFAPNNELEPLFVTAGWRAHREQRGYWQACGAADIVLNDN